jgi:hypothetical protein
MLRRILAAAAVILLIVMAFPLARDAYQCNRVMSKLDPVLTQQDRQAFQAWQGDALSFAKSLYERCRIAHGQDIKVCEPYRVAQD